MIGLAILLLCLNISEEVADQTTYFNIIDENGAGGGSSGLLLYKGGTVCGDGFDQNAANAVCSLLGYKASGSEWTSGSRWNIQHRYSITLDDVNCWSSSWSSCSYSESYHDCSHIEDVFLTCTSRKEEGPRQRRDSSCFTANLRTSGPVLKQVSYSSYQACEELCIGTEGCKAVVTSPMYWFKTECFIIGDYTLTGNDANGWHTAERECFDKDSDQFNIVKSSGSDGGSSGLLLYKGGTVCGDGFDQNAADAVCSLLGYKASGSTWVSEFRWSGQYGYSITLDDVNCRSSSWSSCTYSEYHDCYHHEDVFLTCTSRKEDSDLFNMVDKTGSDGGSSGLLLYKGGTVCDDDFNQNAADAICSLLGYKASGSTWASVYRWYEQYGYSITLDNVNCRSSSWSSCTYSESHDCTHSEDVFLTCTSREDSDLFNMVDKTGADGGSSGLLLYNGGTVCNDHFDQNAANAVCSLLGYKASGSQWTSESRWDIQEGYSITLGNVNCRNSSWYSCTFSKSVYCTHSEDIFLICTSREDSDQTFNIIDENGSYGGSSGLLLYNGGTVCDDYFDQNAADAVCSLLGYTASGSEWTSESRWDIQEEYSITLDDVNCRSSSWSSCTYSEYPYMCYHREDVFLTCTSREGKKLSAVGIIGIIAAVLVGIFIGVFLCRKNKQRRSSRQCEMEQLRENDTIPSAPVPQPADNVQEGPGTEAAVSIPALGTSYLSPPSYRELEAVSEHGEDKVPTYEDVMANENIYDIAH